ncbi:MAG: hypothetical protein HYT76_03740 [Deltaproteobacteria bacterium]|nr:hypothetical protein [Deltaproteobacteria bacterium]
MKIAILSRYPRADRLHWKRHLIEKLLQKGHTLFIVYGDSSFWHHFKAGLAKYGLHDLLKVYLTKKKMLGGTEDPGYGGKLLKDFAKEKRIPVYFTKNLNSRRSERLFKKLSPSLMILAGTQIMKPYILQKSEKGVLNGHFGLLPEIRGMDTIEWSIVKNKPIGITIHSVDPGVDTGDILSRKIVDLNGCFTLALIRERCRQTVTNELSRIVEEIENDKVERLCQAPNDGKQYFRMNKFFQEKMSERLKLMGSNQ